MDHIFGLEFKDAVMTGAVILGPLLAIQVQKYLEQFREKKQRRLDIFRNLMSTRSERLSRVHVQALNMIDIEFYGRMLPIIKTKYQSKTEQAVTHAWKNYNNHLNQSKDVTGTSIWLNKCDDLFTELLYALAQAMNYDFDKVQLQRDCYRPIAHGDLELKQMNILRGIEKILVGEGALPMFITNIPNSTSHNDEAVMEENEKQEVEKDDIS